MSSISYKVFVTNAIIRIHAVAVFTALFANGLAKVFISQPVTSIAYATILRSAYAMNARWGAGRYATIVHILPIFVLASAKAELIAYFITSAFYCIVGGYIVLHTNACCVIVN
jgi:hypothetical protein